MELSDLTTDLSGVVPLAAVVMLRESFPDLKIRFINVVDLLKLTPATEHPHGLSDRDFDSLFPVDKPIILNFHGYPWLIHRLTYRRTNHRNLHVRGYKEKGDHQHPARSRHSYPDRSLQPRNRRHRSGAAHSDQRGPRQGEAAQHADRLSELRVRVRRGQAGDRSMDLAPGKTLEQM